MSADKYRLRIAWEAARLMYSREETEYYRAKRKAARLLGHRNVRAADLPSNREIREHINAIARQHEGEARTTRLCEMRQEALRMMRLLEPFRPRLIGSTLTGHIRRGSDIDLHVYCNSVETVCDVLENAGVPCEVERKRVSKAGREQTYTHIHVRGRFPVELTVYPTSKVGQVFRCSITGRPMERADLGEVESLIARDHPEAQSAPEVLDVEDRLDRFQVYESLLLPLEHVHESRTHHPEGDVLYHSLQVFELARGELPYDEEFVAAALLHDVGKGIDPRDHVQAGLEALQGYISERTAWFIEHHVHGQDLLSGAGGVRLRRRLEASEDFDNLLLLARCDREGRRWGVPVADVEDALDYLRELENTFGEEG